MKSKDRRVLITKVEQKKSLVVHFKEVVNRLSSTTFQRNRGTWIFCPLLLRTEIESTGCSHHAEKYKASKGWQEKSLKKWEGSELISGKRWLCLKNENVESMSGCLWWRSHTLERCPCFDLGKVFCSDTTQGERCCDCRIWRKTSWIWTQEIL